MAPGADGDVYGVDQSNRICRISREGEVTTIAGSNWYGNNNGPGPEARFQSLLFVAYAPSGNLVVSDAASHVVQRVSLDGNVTMLAGRVAAGGSSEGIPGNFNLPAGLAVTLTGEVYVSDSNNHVIRKVQPDGTVSTYAGVPAQSGGFANGPAAAARFHSPAGLALAADGTLFVADAANAVIRKITPDGAVTTLAGTPGVTGLIDGVGAAARLENPRHLSLDTNGSGDLYFTQGGSPTYHLRKVTPDGTVTTLTSDTESVVMNSDGILLAYSYGEVRRYTRDGQLIDTIGKGHRLPSSSNGPALEASFISPSILTRDLSGNLYVGDGPQLRIRKIDPAGVVSTFIERPGINGILATTSGEIYVAISENCVGRITNGSYATLAGSFGQSGNADGVGFAARFQLPTRLAEDPSGNLVVTDSAAQRIRRVSPVGVVSTVAGDGVPGALDGPALSARFRTPTGVAVAANGDIFVADRDNHTIRRISGGMVTTFAGVPGEPGTVDGTGPTARFQFPSDLAMDPEGHLLVTDASSVVRRISPTGRVHTIAGKSGQKTAVEGLGRNARFNDPRGIVSLPDGGIIVALSGDHCLVRGTPVAGPAPQAGPVGAVLAESIAPANGAVDPGEQVTLPFTLLNGGGGPSKNLTATLLVSPGIEPVGPATQNFGALAPGQHGTMPFTFTAQGTCGRKVTAILALSDGSNDLGRAEFEIQLGPSPVVTVLENFETTPGLPPGWQANNGFWNIIGPETGFSPPDLPTKFATIYPEMFISESYLESPPYLLPSGTNQLRFRQVWSVASGHAVRLMISVNGGAFVNAASIGSFSAGPYNARSPASSQSVWQGACGLPYVQTALDLPSELAGQSVRLRFRVTGYQVNWSIDQLELANWPGPKCLGLAAPAFTSHPPGIDIVLGMPFSHQFTASGNPPPTFSVTSGDLPPGLTLSPSGLLSGTPTLAGDGRFPNITVTATNGVNPATSQIFPLRLVTTAASYLSEFSLSGPDAEPMADPNSDGVSNLMAYALGLSPVRAQASALPHAQLVTVGGQSFLQFVFPRSALATDLYYRVQASSDLVNWTIIASSNLGEPTLGAGVVESGAAPYFSVEVRVPVTNSARFLRLRVFPR